MDKCRPKLWQHPQWHAGPFYHIYFWRMAKVSIMIVRVWKYLNKNLLRILNNNNTCFTNTLVYQLKCFKCFCQNITFLYLCMICFISVCIIYVFIYIGYSIKPLIQIQRMKVHYTITEWRYQSFLSSISSLLHSSWWIYLWALSSSPSRSKESKSIKTVS